LVKLIYFSFTFKWVNSENEGRDLSVLSHLEPVGQASPSPHRQKRRRYNLMSGVNEATRVSAGRKTSF